MAGDWIAWTKGLARKREVLLIGRRLGIKPLLAAAMCMVVWEWADSETVDGCMDGMTPGDLDIAVGRKGFALAMQEVGWLAADDNGLRFPNWQRWNGRSAKGRILDSRRKQSGRAAESQPVVP